MKKLNISTKLVQN